MPRLIEHCLGIYALSLTAEYIVIALAFWLGARWSLTDAEECAAIQVASGWFSPLWLLGILVCGVLSLTMRMSGAPGIIASMGPQHWPKWAWIWDNEIDGIFGPTNTPYTRWQAFYWSALRNPVNNFRFVVGVSQKGRPLWYKTWTILGKQFYAKAGWKSDGYPCFSVGAGRGY